MENKLQKSLQEITLSVNIDILSQFNIKSEEDFHYANQTLIDLRKALNKVDDTLAGKTAKLKAIVKRYTEIANEFRKPLEIAKSGLTDKLIEYELNRRTTLAEQERRSAIAKADAIITGKTLLQTPTIAQMPKAKTREIKTWIVQDVSAVPVVALDNETVKDAIIKANRAALTAGKQIKGIVMVKRMVAG